MSHRLPPSSSASNRPLLPAEPRSDTNRAQLSSSQQLVPKLPKSASACGTCRKRKIKCDARRPSCSACALRQVPCVYSSLDEQETRPQALKRKYMELSERKSTHEEVFDMLQRRPEREAQDILARIRNGSDAQSVVRQVQEGDILLQLALRPETRYRFEFLLVKGMPGYLQQMENPYLNSLVYEWTRDGAQTFHVSSSSAEPTRALSNSVTEPETPYLRPYTAAELVDAQIESVKPSEWTTVSTKDDMMRELIQAYFLPGSQFFICFHKDYFLRDMAATRHRFCSALLVNAVLAVGYVCYNSRVVEYSLPLSKESCHMKATKRYEYWNPQNLGYQFLAEARRLWQLEVGKSRLTTIHAGLVITLLHNMSCLDKLGWTYTLQAISIAYNMQIFNPNATVKGRTQRRLRDFTAWTLFNYQCIHCYVMFDQPVIKTPPEIPLPDPSVDPDWYGQMWIKYPASPKPVSTHFEHFFKATAHIRVIMNDVGLQCFGGSAPSRRVTINQALEFRARLKDWQDRLPFVLSPERIVYPGHFILHMNYQTVLMNLFEPFRETGLDDNYRALGIFATEASIHLETLIRLYFLRHSFECFDPFLIHLLNVLGFSVANRLQVGTEAADLDAIRSTMILVAKGMYDQGQCHYIGHVTLRFLKSGMKAEDIIYLGQIAALGEVENEIPKRRMHEVQARWAPSILKVTDDPEAQRLSNLVKKYMDLHLNSDSDQSSTSSP